ncbi:MAG: exodeoxyribonuclease VII large subunit [Acidimicrobiia bacterium]
MELELSLSDSEPTFSVAELNQVISQSLVATFPRAVWVRGEIQQLKRSKNGHAYFELVEKNEKRDGVRAVLRVALFRDARAEVNRSLRATPGVKISDGVEVRICGRVDFYSVNGRLQLVMNAIDPVFTVGKMAADRERVVRVLTAEGILRQNGELDMPLVPLRIGLVTSGGSAAYRDFVHELETSGHAFQLAHVDVRVQGAGSPRRIAYALRRLAGMEVDAVVIVRGGGARSDLAAFDTEIVARAVAVMPMPVLTGIGHEIDRTVADEVAHTCCKTPTAAAALLVEHVDEYEARLAWVGHRVSARARGACSMARRELEDLARRMHRGVPVALVRERHTLDGHRRRVLDAGRRGARHAIQRIDAAQDRLRALDPRRVLERGYTITRDEHGKVLRSVAAVGSGDQLVTEMADGSVRSRVEETQRSAGRTAGSAQRRRPRREDDE